MTGIEHPRCEYAADCEALLGLRDKMEEWWGAPVDVAELAAHCLKQNEILKKNDDVILEEYPQQHECPQLITREAKNRRIRVSYPGMERE